MPTTETEFRQESELRHLQRVNKELLTACKAAEQFIANGIEFGYIAMPDAGTPDTAHETLPMIRRAIATATGKG